MRETVAGALVGRGRGSAAGLIALALTTGIGAGAGAVIFRYLILWFTLVFTGHVDYSIADHEPHPWLPALGMWFVVLAPIAGGLVYGPLIDRFAREARGHGVPEVMLAVAMKGGRIRPRVAIVKSLASALCIGSGGSLGREGPIVQIGSALGSALGQLLRANESRLRLLVACGAAGGISATFNAPIAGAMFGLELILRDFEAESFGAVLLSSVAANVVGRAAFGPQPFLTLPPFELRSFWEYILYAVFGVLIALAGTAFIAVLYGTEELVDRIWKGPGWLRPAAGGVALGLLLVVLPQLYGVGYPVLQQAIMGAYSSWFLLLLFGGKILASSLTIAIGGSGGVFAPSLFIGAALGTAYGQLVHGIFPSITAQAGAYGLVGMGGLFAAAARAPMTSAIIIFELTGDYRIMVPLIFTISLATTISNFLTRDTIYTLKLRRQGIDVLNAFARPMSRIVVSQAMREVSDTLPQDLSLADAVRRFVESQRDALPVVDQEGSYCGIVTPRRIEEAMRDGALEGPVGALAERPPTLHPSDTLEQALDVLVSRDVPGLPVVDGDGQKMVGWLAHSDVLRAYHEHFARTRI